MKTAEELIAAAKALILDFDGPITDLMPSPKNTAAAQKARHALAGVDLPEEIQASKDHLAILRWTFANLPSRLLDVEAACTEAEVECAKVSEPSPELPWLLEMSKTYDLPIGIASNNSDAAVRTYLERADWKPNVISGRTPDGVRMMKPHPAYVLGCAEFLDVKPAEAVFVGDSVSDAEASHAAKTRFIGLSKSESRVSELLTVGADALMIRAS